MTGRARAVCRVVATTDKNQSELKRNTEEEEEEQQQQHKHARTVCHFSHWHFLKLFVSYLLVLV